MKTLLLTIEVISGIALVAAVLLHPPKGEGLGAIGGQARLFANTHTQMEKSLDRITYILATCFFVSAAVLGIFYVV